MVRLSRRDAILALAASTVGVYGATNTNSWDTETDDILSTLHAVTEVIYPSAVTVDPEFVRTYVLGKANLSPNYNRQIAAVVSELNAQARRDYSRTFSTLTPANRRAVFRSLGVHATLSDPDGTVAQRIRYYVINDLLYALYTRPLGGRVVGVENPPGYPGGRDAYQQGPSE